MIRTNQRTYLAVRTRMMIQRDIEDALQIEANGSVHPATEEKLLAYIRRRDICAIVAESGSGYVGHLIYAVEHRRLEILRLVVNPAERRRGVGTQLMVKLDAAVKGERLKAIQVIEPDTNLEGHLFLKACGFKAVEILPCFFEATRGDGYRFEMKAS